jgi:hypothetical protein
MQVACEPGDFEHACAQNCWIFSLKGCESVQIFVGATVLHLGCEATRTLEFERRQQY